MSIYLYMAFIDEVRANGADISKCTLKDLEEEIKGFKIRYNR